MASRRAERRFHEAGVGSRTGMRAPSMGADLDDFLSAGKRALDEHVRSDEEDDYDEDEEEEEDDDYEGAGGRSRRSIASRRSVANGSSSRRGQSSMMDIQQSSPPSPHSAYRRSIAHSRASDAGSVIDYDSPRQSSSRAAGRTSRPGSSSRAAAYDDYPADDDVPMDFGDHPSFDLSAMAGDDDAAAAPSDAGSADETMRRPRAPAAGLAARRAAQERSQQGRRSTREASVESAAELSGELLEEIVEPDVGEEALDYTTAGQWDVHEARKGASVSPVKAPGKAGKKKAAAAAADESEVTARPRPRPKGGKSAQKASSSAPAKTRAPAKGKKRAVEDSDSGSEYDAAPPLRVDKRTVQRTKTTGGRRGPTAVVQQQVVERIPSAYHRGTSEESEGGVRRSGRYRYQPLEYWRGERARFGRPSMPAVRETAEDEEPIDGDAFERLPGKSYGAPPVPVLKEIVRIPRGEDEGTFAGMKRPRAKSAMPPGGKKPVVKRRKAGSVDEEVEFELDPTAPTVHPEDGWDKDTEPHGLVWDVDAESEVSRRIVCTSSQVRPRTAFNNSFAFEKVFGVDEFMAAGVLDIPVGGSKPTKPTKDNNYVFVVIEGAVRARVHRTNFHLAPGGIFLVPKGNTYSLENICQRPCRIFFSQARNTAALAPAAEAHTG